MDWIVDFMFIKKKKLKYKAITFGSTPIYVTFSSNSHSTICSYFIFFPTELSKPFIKRLGFWLVYLLKPPNLEVGNNYSFAKNNTYSTLCSFSRSTTIYKCNLRNIRISSMKIMQSSNNYKNVFLASFMNVVKAFVNLNGVTTNSK